MKVKMKKIYDNDEKIIIPLYFIGNETDEYVELDEESIRNEFELNLKKLVE